MLNPLPSSSRDAGVTRISYHEIGSAIPPNYRSPALYCWSRPLPLAAMPEDAKAGELETREHMGRAPERPPSEPARSEGLFGAGALKEYLEATRLPELESIARTPDQLAAIQLAQLIRIAEALERIASALERPRGAGESQAPGDAISSR
jgi:hypothetical protein